MHKFNKIITVIMFALFFSFFNVQTVSAIDNFEILDLEVNINVNEDGVYDVTEKFKINYFLPALGIYRDLKTSYALELYDEDTNETITKTYYMPITDINLEGDVYSVETQTSGERIIVGEDEGAERFTGVREYTISYKIHTEKLDLMNQEEGFFQNLISDWSASVHNFKANVNFYKEVDMDKIVTKADSYSNGENVNYSCEVVSSKTFSCAFNEEVVFGNGNGITAFIPLPDDYFMRPEISSHNIVSLMSISVVFIFALFMNMKYRSHYPIIEKVSFKAPEGFNSPMVASVYSNPMQANAIYGLIFEWANLGFIEIIMDDSTSKKDPDLSFKKLKDIDINRESFEVKLFNAMFKDDEIQTVSKWQTENIYEDIATASFNISKAVKAKGEIYTKKNQTKMVLTMILITLTYAYVIYQSLNKVLLSSDRTIALVIIMTIIFFFINLISSAISFNYDHKGNVKKAKLVNIVAILLTVATAYVSLVVAEMTIYVKINEIVILSYSAISSLSFILSSKIYGRTKYGSDLLGEIHGLRSFIKYAKKDELEMMVNDHPYLYYDVLPYAFIFGFSTLWLDKFKNINIQASPYYPSRTSTMTDYMIYRSLTRSMMNVNTQIIPKIEAGKSSGSFSSSGGGFSGGGFSGGGGFGGGGGGGR